MNIGSELAKYRSLSDEKFGIPPLLPDLQFEFNNKLWRFGVDHRDNRPQNFFWNEEKGQWFVIDFERSRLLAKGCLDSAGVCSLGIRRSKKRMAGVGSRTSSSALSVAVKN